MATEIEEHKGRVFDILSNFRENLGYTLEQNVPAVEPLAVGIPL